MKWIATRYLQSKLRKRKRKVYFHSLKRAKTALLIYNGTDQAEESKIIQFGRYLKEEGLEVESLVFYAKTGKQVQKPSDERGRYYFDPKELNWLSFPKLSSIRKRLSKDYDLMVDLNLKNDFSLEVLSSLSKAKFKVGPAQNYGQEILDLSIKTKNHSLEYLLEQIQVYLEMINKRK